MSDKEIDNFLKHELLFRSIPEFYIILSTELRIKEITNKLILELNIQREEVLNKPILDLFPEIKKTIEVRNKEHKINIRSNSFDKHWDIAINQLDQYIFLKLTIIDTSNENYKNLLLRSIADSFPGIIALYNRFTGEYLYINKSIETITGYTQEQVLKGGLQFITSIIHPDDLDLIMEENNKALETARIEYPNYDESKVTPFEYRIKVKDGSYKWIRTYGIIFQRNENKEVELILNTSIDITEIKEAEIKAGKAEKELQSKVKESKEEILKKDSYYHFLTDTIPGIFWTANPDGSMEYYSNKFKEFTGMSTEEAIQGGWTKVLHPDDAESSFKKVEHSIKTGEEYKIEHRIKSKDGGYRWFLSRAVPLKDDKGHILKWFGTSFDIDDEIRTLEELKESRTKYKFLADSIPQIIYTFTIEGRTDYLNKKWYEYTGLEQGDLDLQRINDVVHPDDIGYLEKTYANSIQTGEPFSLEFRLRKYTGEYRWFLGKAVPMKDNQGNVIKWFGSSTDIQEQKETIERLANTEKRLNKINNEISKKNEELSKINNDLDNFIYTASHDLKAPISNIEGLTNFLKSDEFYKTAEVKEVMDLMEKSTERFKKTIAGLTDVAKIQKTFNEEIEEINIEELIKEVVSDIPEFDQSKAKIETDLQVHNFKFPRKNARSILYNLIGNAIKYRSEHRTPLIKIKTKETSDYIVLSVEDNGMGIEKDSHEKVFKMFKRLHTHIEGTGIGLYIVKRIMDNAGGKIEIDSTPGKGTTFTLYFKKL